MGDFKVQFVCTSSHLCLVSLGRAFLIPSLQVLTVVFFAAYARDCWPAMWAGCGALLGHSFVQTFNSLPFLLLLSAHLSCLQQCLVLPGPRVFRVFCRRIGLFLVGRSPETIGSVGKVRNPSPTHSFPS